MVDNRLVHKLTQTYKLTGCISLKEHRRKGRGLMKSIQLPCHVRKRRNQRGNDKERKKKRKER